MANVLGTLFQDIANAIRGKTGDTATMKPAEFPDKIAAIEAGGGSAGGCSIEIDTRSNPSLYYQSWINNQNGDLYAYSLTYTGYGASGGKLYKYQDGKWTNLLTDLNLSPACFNGAVYYNGKYHIISNNEYHWTWDGDVTFTQLNPLPNRYYNGYIFVFNNKLMYHADEYGILYEWNDDSDTWSEVAQIFSNYEYAKPFVYNNELYFMGTYNLYKYSDGALTLLKTFTFSDKPFSYADYVIINNYLYYTRNLTITPIVRMNLDTLEDEVITYVGMHNKMTALRIIDNRLWYITMDENATIVNRMFINV